MSKMRNELKALAHALAKLNGEPIEVCEYFLWCCENSVVNSGIDYAVMPVYRVILRSNGYQVYPAISDCNIRNWANRLDGQFNLESFYDDRGDALRLIENLIRSCGTLGYMFVPETTGEKCRREYVDGYDTSAEDIDKRVGSFACPHCLETEPHEHSIDHKGFLHTPRLDAAIATKEGKS